jgi:predicted alpha/beta hydrolase family esterase
MEERVTRLGQVLFIQGAGAGTHDDWDLSLVESLRHELGDGFEVRYPRMPDEADPANATWGPAIRRELEALDEGSVVVGHSVGGTMLVHALTEPQLPAPALGAIILIAAPFVGAGGWPSDELELPDDLGARLPQGVPVHLFHGLEDETAPPSHADLFARAVPQARLHRLPGRDHQLNDDLAEVASVIRAIHSGGDGAGGDAADAPGGAGGGAGGGQRSQAGVPSSSPGNPAR